MPKTYPLPVYAGLGEGNPKVLRRRAATLDLESLPVGIWVKLVAKAEPEVLVAKMDNRWRVWDSVSDSYHEVMARDLQAVVSEVDRARVEVKNQEVTFADRGRWSKRYEATALKDKLTAAQDKLEKVSRPNEQITGPNKILPTRFDKGFSEHGAKMNPQLRQRVQRLLTWFRDWHDSRLADDWHNYLGELPREPQAVHIFTQMGKTGELKDRAKLNLLDMTVATPDNKLREELVKILKGTK